MKHIKDVNVVLYDPNQDFRIMIHGILRDSGFAEIVSTERAETVQKRLGEEHVDLLIGDVHAETSAICGLLGDVRNGRLGDNPFPVAIGLTSDADEKTIAKIGNAGFDGLALKPFDSLTFRRRVEYFLEHRKPFVTTADYVGPDRRKDPGKPGVDSNCIDVPNPLRLIAEGISRDTLAQLVEAAAGKLDERKFVSDIGGVGWCAEKLVEAMRKSDAELAERCIRQLNEIAKDMDDRLERTPYRHVQEACNSLLGVAARLEQAAAGPDKKDVKRLGDLAQAIARSCNVDRSHAA